MTDTESPLRFETLDDPPGVEIVDQLEHHRCRIHTHEPVRLNDVGTGEFRFPVDNAIQVSAAKITLPTVNGVLIRDEDGSTAAKVEFLDEESLPVGRYSLELFGQFRSYIEVESSITLTAGVGQIEVDFGSETTLLLGARSEHSRPAATVTTTEEPTDVMAAIETFGSALKTTKADRSLPSLRGHPPAVEIGDRLDIPSEVESPETGVTVELPPRLDAIYVATPLVYYLGANVVPGPTPRLTTECGFEHRLSEPEGFETAVERTLRQVFFLDCITRTEGLYEVNLHERNEIEHIVDLQFDSLYEQPISQQLVEYLDIPFAVVEEFIPDWRLTTHVEPTPQTVELLPFVMDDLSIIRTPETHVSVSAAVNPRPTRLTSEDTFTRSTNTQSSTVSEQYVEPYSANSLEQAWIGESIPIGASKLTAEAFKNRIDRDRTEGDISISIVVNDPRMEEERDLVDRAYDSREALPFDVTVHTDLQKSELRELLASETGFLHYIGHTERDGFECTDGKLDVRSIDDTGVEAFLLNACNSYTQGLGLIEAGGIGGIVTLNDVINEGAVRIGESIARLLNAGFPLRAALTIARDESVFGGQYIVVGDGGMTVTHPVSGTPNLLNVRPVQDGFDVEIETFTTDVAGVGSVFMPHIEGNEKYFLSSGSIETFSVSREELARFLRLQEVPVRYGETLYWSSGLDVNDLA